MVDMILLQQVSYIAGALGVCIAATYYVMNLRMTQKRAKIDAAILYGNLITDKEKVKAWRSFLYEIKGTNFEELEKYRTDPELYSNMYTTGGSLVQIGVLLKENVIDTEMLMRLVSPLWIKVVGRKMRPYMVGMRTIFNDPLYGYYVEYALDWVEKNYPDVKVPEERYPLNKATP